MVKEFLSDYNGTVWQYPWIFPVRMILYAACAMEVARWGTFVLIWMVIVHFTAAATARGLHHVTRGKCVRLLTEFRLLFIATSDVLKLTHFTNICICYFLTLFLLWFMISLWGIVPLMILSGAGVTVALLIHHSLVVFAKTGELGVESSNLVCSHLNRYFCTSDVRKSDRLLLYKIWRAQRPVELWCGPFFVLDNATSSAFLHQVFDKLITAVLLIKPTMLAY